MNLPIFIKNPAGPDEAGGVEHMPRPLRIDFQKRAGLNIHTQLLGLFAIPIRVLVGDRQRQPLNQFLDGGIDRRCMTKLGERDQPHIEKWLISAHRKFNHLQHAFGSRRNFLSRRRIWRIDLAGGRIISRGAHLPFIVRRTN